MGRTLFEDLVVSRADGGGASPLGRRLPASLIVHAIGVSALVVVPMLRHVELPQTETPAGLMTFPAAATPTPPPEEPPKVRIVTPPRNARGPVDPVQPAAEADARPGPIDPTAGGDPGPSDGPPPCLANCGTGDPYATGTGAQDAVAMDPGPVGPARSGVDVSPPVRLVYVDPRYPELARRAGVEGIVILECVVGADGRVRDVRVLRGHPLLNAAAVDAVQQWTYKPTQLRGVPVPVVMTVTVRFHVQR